MNWSKKKPNAGLASGMSEFLPNPIPPSPLPSYNYGARLEPEVCIASFSNQRGRIRPKDYCCGWNYERLHTERRDKNLQDVITAAENQAVLFAVWSKPLRSKSISIASSPLSSRNLIAKRISRADCEGEVFSGLLWWKNGPEQGSEDNLHSTFINYWH